MISRDDVLRMWKQAQHPDLTDEDIAVRFAALVAAAEREACAKVCEERAARHVESSEMEDTEDLRERCLVYAKHVGRCAVAIRLRAGET